MSENANSKANSNSGSFFDGFSDIVILLCIALFCCNRCVYPVIDNTEIENGSDFAQAVFLDRENITIDGKYLCPAVMCEEGAFLSEHTKMLYSIEGADSNAVISDAFTKIGNGKYEYNGKLVTDTPFVPIDNLSGIKGGETLDVSLVEDSYARIHTRTANVHNRFYVVPRGEEQSFDAWRDSCRVKALDDVINPYFRAVFISGDNVSSGIFIGDYSLSTYEREEYIAKLNQDAYKERNNTTLQINDVDIAYYCKGTAANITISFNPAPDTISCNFFYHLLYKGHIWPRKDKWARLGYQSACILPGQTKYEFNVTPERIIRSVNDDRIADLALVGVEVAECLSIIEVKTEVSRGRSIKDMAAEGVASALLNNEPDKKYYIADYDHRSTFWQKITLKRDLSPAWWKLILAIVVGIIAFFCEVVSYSSDRVEKIARIIGCVILSLTIVYAIMWVILSTF